MTRQIFTHIGGYPMTQDRLADMQAGWEEDITAMLSMFNENDLGKGVILSGLAMLRTGDYVDISAGWIAAKAVDEDPIVMFVEAQTGMYVPESTNKVVVEKGRTYTSLTYKDGSTFNAIMEVFGGAHPAGIGLANTPGVLMAVDTMVPYYAAIGHCARTNAYTELEMDGSGVGSISGSLFYRHDKLANTVHIKGSLTIADMSTLAALPAKTSVDVGTMSVSVTSPASICATVRSGGPDHIKTSDGVDYLRSVFLYIGANIISIEPLPSEGDVSYSVDVNAIISLD